MKKITKYEISKEDLLLYKDLLSDVKQEKIVAIDTQVSQPHDKTIKKILEEKEEVVKFLKAYIKINEDEKMIEWVKDMLYVILSKKLNEEAKFEIKRILREMEENKMDDEWVERINRGDAEEKEKMEKKIEKKMKEGEKRGIKTAIIQMVKNMLNNNETDEKIILYANINKNELRKIKKELRMQES